jgi:tRNA 2-thiouridine synthesizing protein E
MLQAQTIEEAAGKTSSQIADVDGYLIDPFEWSRDYAQKRAAEQQLELDGRHWNLIEIIRDKYLRLGALPPMRIVCKAAGFDRNELKRQFGSCLNLWKLAGLPNPGEEARAYMN